MTGYRFHVVHKDKRKLISNHATHHNRHFQRCYELKAHHKIKPHQNPKSSQLIKKFLSGTSVNIEDKGSLWVKSQVFFS